MLWATENLLGTWRAGVPYGDRNGSRIDGVLLLTNQRLIFQLIRLFQEWCQSLCNGLQVVNAMYLSDVYISVLRDMVSTQPVGKYRVEMGWWRIRSGQTQMRRGLIDHSAACLLMMYTPRYLRLIRILSAEGRERCGGDDAAVSAFS